MKLFTKKSRPAALFFLAAMASLVLIGKGHATQYKVLVVMSYEESYPWVQDIRQGIETELGDTCQISYFFMDTKRFIDKGPQKAKEAYALYQSLQPDGVIAVDDNAQSMFVLPYLKSKVKTPVMFCGVNNEPETYGYPASNVSGVLELELIKEAIVFAQQLVPSIRTIAHIQKDSPSAKAVQKQIATELQAYTASFIGFETPRTLDETIAVVRALKTRCDALLTPTMQGITDADGRPLDDAHILPIMSEAFGKPIIGTNDYNVKDGILCAVVKIGCEQGATAARMLIQAMKGTPVSRIPVTRIHNGKRVINVTVMKSLGIKPDPSVLRGAELVRMKKHQ